MRKERGPRIRNSHRLQERKEASGWAERFVHPNPQEGGRKKREKSSIRRVTGSAPLLHRGGLCSQERKGKNGGVLFVRTHGAERPPQLARSSKCLVKKKRGLDEARVRPPEKKVLHQEKLTDRKKKGRREGT